MQPNGHCHRLSKLENENANALDLDQELPFSKERDIERRTKIKKKREKHQLHFSDSDAWWLHRQRYHLTTL